MANCVVMDNIVGQISVPRENPLLELVRDAVVSILGWSILQKNFSVGPEKACFATQEYAH